MTHPFFTVTISCITSAVLAYFAFRLYYLRQLNINNTGIVNIKNKLMFAVLFGFFTAYTGFMTAPDGTNVRLLYPIFVGIMAGSGYGMLTGLFGVALLCFKAFIYHRLHEELLSHTFYYSAFVIILAGYAAGIWHRKLQGRLPKILNAVAFCIAFELAVRLPFKLFTAERLDIAWSYSKAVYPEMIAATSIGMALMIFVIRNLLQEKLALMESKRIDAELISARVVQRGLVKKNNPLPFSIPNIDVYAGIVNEEKASNIFFEYCFCVSERKFYFIIVEMEEITTTATLCMLVIKTLFRNKAQMAVPLQKIVDDIRRELTIVNADSKTRSVFGGTIDVDSGLLIEGVNINYGVLLKDTKGVWSVLPKTDVNEKTLGNDEALLLVNGFDNAAERERFKELVSASFIDDLSVKQNVENITAVLKQDNDNESGALMCINYRKSSHFTNL